MLRSLNKVLNEKKCRYFVLACCHDDMESQQLESVLALAFELLFK